MPDEYINIAPGPDAYTPAMLHIKKHLEVILSIASAEDAEGLLEYIKDWSEDIKSQMSTVLSENILYKVGVPYKPNLDLSLRPVTYKPR